MHLIKCFINMHRNVSGFHFKHATKDTSKSFKVPYYSLFMCCIKGNMQFQKVQHFKLNRIMHVIVGFSQVCSNKVDVYLVNSPNSFITTNFFYRCKQTFHSYFWYPRPFRGSFMTILVFPSLLPSINAFDLNLARSTKCDFCVHS